MSSKLVERRLNDFQRRYDKEDRDAALELACYAALPVALNPELLHFLRINFFFDPPQQLPHTVEFEFLTSGLCREIDVELYEIEPETRNELLKRLMERNDAPQRIRDVATLLWQYVEHHSPWADRVELERAQQLTALHFLNPEKAQEWLDKANADHSQNGGGQEWFIAMRQEINQLSSLFPSAPSTQYFLDESDIDTLINLLLRSQESRTREALCFSIGIDPKRLSFIRESSDSDFFLLLIRYLNEINDREALCKLCCKELLPIFHQGKYATILSEIAAKLNCAQSLTGTQAVNRNVPVPEQLTPILKKKPNIGQTVAKRSQYFLDEFDIDTLINLLLRSQQSRTREALCFSIGIDPKRLSFIRESSDSDFFLLLIRYLNEINDREALCKLCCKELLPIFHQGKYATILSEIAAKLNCTQSLTGTQAAKQNHQHRGGFFGRMFDFFRGR